MKKIIGLLFLLNIILLYITNSMYADWIEIFIIIGCVSAVSIVYNILSKKQAYNHIVGSSAVMAFLCSMVLVLIDIVIDHYKVTQGIPDGKFLTLSETLAEASYNLVVIVLLVTLSVTVISSVFTKIYSKF